MTIERIDRTLLSVIAVAVIGAAIVGWGVRAGWFALLEPGEVAGDVLDRLDLPVWWPVLAVVVGIVVTVIGVRFAVAQLPRPRHLGVGDVRVGASARGDTLIEPDALAHVVEDGLIDVPGVRGARVTAASDSTGSVNLQLRVDVHRDVDVTEVRRGAATVAEQLAENLGVPVAIDQTLVRLDRAEPSRVV